MSRTKEDPSNSQREGHGAKGGGSLLFDWDENRRV